MNFGKEQYQFATQHMGVSKAAMDNHIDNITPYIIEERPMRVSQLDIYSRMMMDRIIFLNTGVTEEVANIIISQLLFLNNVDKDREIKMYINSPGGSVYAGLAIYDTMHIINAEVATLCTGMAASMAAVLLAAGSIGKRSATPLARVMIHQPLGGASGQFKDMMINLKQMETLKVNLYTILSDKTGKSLDKVESDCERDYWMNSAEAEDYGIIDSIIEYTKSTKR